MVLQLSALIQIFYISVSGLDKGCILLFQEFLGLRGGNISKFSPMKNHEKCYKETYT